MFKTKKRERKVSFLSLFMLNVSESETDSSTLPQSDGEKNIMPDEIKKGKRFFELPLLE